MIMRKTLVAAATAAVLLGGSLTPAVAATSAEIPSDVQVSWADMAKGWLRVTWTDDGQANFVDTEVDGWPSNPTGSEARTEAGGNNEVILKGVSTNHDKVRVTVRNNTPSETARAASAWFDTRKPSIPVVDAAVPQADLSLRVSFTQAPVVDITPDDPLDRPAAEGSLVVYGGLEQIKLPLGSATVTIPPRARPFSVQLYATNEWGSVRGDRYVTFGTTTAALAVEAVGTFGSFISFAAAAEAKDCLPDCGNLGGSAYLQARANATQPWKTIGTYYVKGKFSGNFGIAGGRYYRLYVPSWTEWTHNDNRGAVTSAVSTSARYSATRAAFRVAGFNTFTAKVGQVVKLTVEVRPAGTVKGDLQVWDGKVWRHAGYVPLVKGKGTLSVKAAGRGTTRSWRVVVPKMMYNGLPIVATPSRAFKLTVS
jgi:hypothetical protein